MNRSDPGPSRRVVAAGAAMGMMFGASARAQPVTDAPVFASLAGAARPSEFRVGRRPSSRLSTALAQMQAVSDRFGGQALLVWRDGRLIHETYAAGVGPQTQLVTYSMAKSVLGLVFGLALEDGVIASLDAPVSDHVEAWRDDPRGAITLRQLLQMRSGLKLYALSRNEPQAVEMARGRAVTRTALATPLARPPGAMFEYANVNSQIAGHALDRALARAGRGGYPAYLQARLWAPLRQAAARLGLEFEGGQPRYFAGLDAPARDWLRLGLLFANAGRFEGRRIVSPDWIAEMTRPSPNPNYGLQIWRGAPWTARRAYGPDTPVTAPCLEPYIADDLVFFDGSGGQRVYVSAKEAWVIVRIGAMSWDWEDSVLPNTLSRAAI